MIYDLHAHSTASDGTLTPTALVQRAAEHEVDVLALTDHDDTAGIAEAAMAAADVGLRLLAGVEISVSWNKATVHIVGLNIDPDHAPLRDGLAALRDKRGGRAERIAAGLHKAGIEGALEGAKRHVSGAILSRTHFARFLIEQGHARDMRQVFKRYLVRGKPGHVSIEWADLATAVGWITASGGQAVIAHPARYGMTSGRLERLLAAFKECGGSAIEVLSSSQSEDDARVLAVRAARHGLLASAGSDFHSPDNRWVELGRLRPMPVGVTPIWHDWNITS